MENRWGDFLKKVVMKIETNKAKSSFVVQVGDATKYFWIYC